MPQSLLVDSQGQLSLQDGERRHTAPCPPTVPSFATASLRQVATPSAQHRWRMARQQASASASSMSRTITRPAWRRIRPATCTSFQRTVVIVCDAHAAGQARRLKQ